MKLSELTYLAIDTETNVPEQKGSDKAPHELIEASAVLANVRDDEEYFVDVMDGAQTPSPEKPFLRNGHYTTFLCKPPSPISPEASAIHHLRDEDLVDYPPVEDVLPLFIKRTNNAVWVIHNAAYDWDVLSKAATKAGIDLPKPLAVIDSLLFSQAILKHRRSHKLQVLAHYFKTLRSGKGAHRATADCATLAMVFNRLVRVYLDNGGEDCVEEVLSLICRQAVNVNTDQELWFGKHKGTKIEKLPEDYLLWWLFKRKPEEGKPGDPKLDLLFATEYYKRRPVDAALQKINECTLKCSESITWPSKL